VVEILQKSIHDVFKDSLGIEIEYCKHRPRQKGYVAKIEFSYLNESGYAYLWIQRPTIKTVSEILLFEKNPDDEAIEDLVAELANFIVGHSKMLASDKGLECSIETPVFEGVKTLEDGLKTFLYKVGNRCLAIQIKGVDG